MNLQGNREGQGKFGRGRADRTLSKKKDGPDLASWLGNSLLNRIGR